MSEVITQNSAPVAMQGQVTPTHNPFQRMQASHINAGSVAIESERAIAEAQAKMVIAKRFPRDEAAAFSKAMQACQRKTLADSAFYSYPRGGETISGPSIRLAEELARCWGNIEYGIRELSRKDGVSEMQAFAIDLETNIHSVQNFTVRHIRDRRGGGKELTDERDIYELTANMGGRRLRARILAILPPDLKDAAVAQCRQTIAGGGEIPLADRVKRMVVAFAKIGVSDDLLIKRLGHKLDVTTPDELADLHGIYTSIKDGVSKIADWFGDGNPNEGDDQKTGINSVVQKQAAKPATDKPAADKPASGKPVADRKPTAGRRTAAAAEPAAQADPENQAGTQPEVTQNSRNQQRNSSSRQDNEPAEPVGNLNEEKPQATQPQDDEGLVF